MTSPPGVDWLGDVVTVELAAGAAVATTYGAGRYGENFYGQAVPWETWDCEILEARIARGRQNTRERYKTGTLELTAAARLPAWTGATQPTGRPIRVTAGPWVMFSGVIQLAELQWTGESRLWTIAAVDDLARLAQIVPAGLTRPMESLPDRVSALLTIAGAAAPPLGGTGRYVQPIVDSGRTLADHLGIAIDTWEPTRGSVYADRWGTVRWGVAPPATVDGRYPVTRWSTYDPGSDGLIGWLGCPVRAVVDWDVGEIVNKASLANAGGTAVPFEDLPSQSRYGPRTFQRHDLIAEPTTPPNWNITSEWLPYLATIVDARARLTELTWDLWSFPPPERMFSGVPPFEDVLGGVDVTQTVAVRLPPDEAGKVWSTNLTIEGLTWELGPQRVNLTVTGQAILTSS